MIKKIFIYNKEKMPTKCKTGYMVNPNTGRCIKIGGPTHKKLYPTKSKTKRITPPHKSKSKRKDIKR
jgi:hypothetical protein